MIADINFFGNVICLEKQGVLYIMSAEAAFPSYAWGIDGAILTFVIPAFGGCDLACPFCFIDQRSEDVTPDTLWTGNYSHFVQ